MNLSGPKILVVINRMITQTLKISSEGGKLESIVDTSVGLELPPRSFSPGEKQQIDMQVLEATNEPMPPSISL